MTAASRRTALFIAVMLGWMVRPASCVVDNAAVAAALNKATAFLFSKQKDGNWEKSAEGKYTNDNTPTGGQWGGQTAIATYALLAAGHSPQEPALARAIEFLKKADVRGTYALSMRMQVWLLLPESREITQLMKRDATTMLNMTQAQGSALGMHDYTAANQTYSHSRTQYAVLALWAAEQMGMEVPAKYWEVAEAGWLDHQDPSGGWTYRKKGETELPLTPGMTAAGVATLFIIQDYLHAAKSVECRGAQSNPAAAGIDKGVKWLAEHFDKIATSKRYERDFPFATLYAVERVGVAGGLKYFGTHDWYDKGANWLLKVQKPDGSFGLPNSMDHIFGPIVETSFATLFLVRGRGPVAFAKLDYSAAGKPAGWNQRPRDIANAVRWIGQSLERDLNWQVVNLQVTPEEWLDAPILYISGSQPLNLSEQQEQKLRAFVEMGGLIVGHADCSGAGFINTFRKVGQKLFPRYEFRELPADHIIYNNNFKYASWRAKPAILGLSNGARELMLLIHGGDPARFWQVRATKGREEPWQLAANLFLYTSDRKDLRFKGDTHIVLPRKDAPARGARAVARIEYPQNWDPEAGGWRRMAAILRNEDGIDLQVAPVELGKGPLSARQYPIAHLTGTARFKLPGAAVEELRKYVSEGGLLVIDACGGSSDFADSAELLAKSLFPDAPATPLPETHPLYQLTGSESAKSSDGTGKPGGASSKPGSAGNGKASSVKQPLAIQYRPFAQRALLGQSRAGRLLGVVINNRLGIILSREDLSTGLVGQQVDGILGYAPQTAAALMRNILLWPGTSAARK